MISLSKIVLIPMCVVGASCAVYFPISSALNAYKPSKITTIIESENFKDNKMIEHTQRQKEIQKIKDSTKEGFISDTMNKNINNVVSHVDIEFENKTKKAKKAKKPATPLESSKPLEPPLESPAKKQSSNAIESSPNYSTIESNQLKAKKETKAPSNYRSINTHPIRF